MASVAKDARDGRWLARWRDPGGRQRKRSFDRKVDAQRWLDQMRADMHRGQYIDPRAGSVRLREVATAWAGGLAHLKESTAVRYRGIVATHVLPAFGDWQLDQVRRSDVQAWVDQLTRAGLSPGSVRQCHRVLSLLLDTAVDDNRIARNPAQRCEAATPASGRAAVPHRDRGGRHGPCGGRRGPGHHDPGAVRAPLRRAGRAPGARRQPPAAPAHGRRLRHRGGRKARAVDAQDGSHQVGAVPGDADTGHRAARARQASRRPAPDLARRRRAAPGQLAPPGLRSRQRGPSGAPTSTRTTCGTRLPAWRSRREPT